MSQVVEWFLNVHEMLGRPRQDKTLGTRAQDGDEIMPGTDIGIPERRIWVVTTAALPWMTGTSVNPLLRAAYLTREREPGKVSLMVPWLGLQDQEFVLPESQRYESKEEQGAYIREWLGEAGMTAEGDALHLVWYDARYSPVHGSIFPMGDITRLIPDDEADVCIMEEPEHLNWFKPSGANWSEKFTHVVGVVHTNYVYYIRADTSHWASGRVNASIVRAYNKIMARAYCDKVIKLSAALQNFAGEKETVDNVNGVRDSFFVIGAQRAQAAARGETFEAGNRAYFLGKMLWDKGYNKLWDLLDIYRRSQQRREGGVSPPGTSGKNHSAPAEHGGTAIEDGGVLVSAYGSGPDSDAIQERAESMGLAVEFHPATDHAELFMYKTFVNPSESEVLCTTVAEALAMGKFVVIAEHASNEFFYQFPNTLKFKTHEEFKKQMEYCNANEPLPLTPEQRHVLGWPAAMERLIQGAKVTVTESLRRRRARDKAAWLLHSFLSSGRRGDRFRKVINGGVVAGQHKHMKLVLKAEREAFEVPNAETAAAAASETSTTKKTR